MASLASGSLLILLEMCREKNRLMVRAERRLAVKTREFSDILSRASEANMTLGTKISEMENLLIALEERVAAMSGQAVLMGKLPWQAKSSSMRQGKS